MCHRPHADELANNDDLGRSQCRNDHMQTSAKRLAHFPNGSPGVVVVVLRQLKDGAKAGSRMPSHLGVIADGGTIRGQGLPAPPASAAARNTEGIHLHMAKLACSVSITTQQATVRIDSRADSL